MAIEDEAVDVGERVQLRFGCGVGARTQWKGECSPCASPLSHVFVQAAAPYPYGLANVRGADVAVPY
jgi:hypothetical protein